MLGPLLVSLLCAQDPQLSVDQQWSLTDPRTKRETSLIRRMGDPSKTPKLSPKQFGTPPAPWSFPWFTLGYGDILDDKGNAIKVNRFAVYSQTKSEDLLDVKVARMLQRLWEYNHNWLGIDNSATFGNGRVDVYLCQLGTPGGEQLFDADGQLRESPVGHDVKVNTIYIYDIKSFTDPVEMAREVAHEYGHASIPGVNGYTDPEDWANGYLGERLFLRHLDELLVTDVITPDDTMGASEVQLKKWVSTNVTPLVLEAASRAPSQELLRDRTAKGMYAYIGLALYMDTILPESVFSRSMQFVGTSQAKDYPDATVTAAEGPSRYTLRIPGYLAGKPIWIPLGTSKIFGATVLKRTGDWAQIKPGTDAVVIVPKQIE